MAANETRAWDASLRVASELAAIVLDLKPGAALVKSLALGYYRPPRWGFI